MNMDDFKDKKRFKISAPMMEVFGSIPALPIYKDLKTGEEYLVDEINERYKSKGMWFSFDD